MHLALTWLKYCRYGVKHYPINQSLTPSPQELLGQSLPNLVCSIFMVKKNQEIVNFMTPTLMGDNFKENFLKLMYFLKNLLYSWEYIKLSSCI